jgi:hypothetical protein
LQILKRLNLLERIEFQLSLEIEPKRAPGGVVEVSCHHFRNLPIQGFAGASLGIVVGIGHGVVNEGLGFFHR